MERCDEDGTYGSSAIAAADKDICSR